MEKHRLKSKGMTIISEALLSLGIILVAVAFVFVGGNIISFQSGGLFSSAQNQMAGEVSSVIEGLPDASGSFSMTYEPGVESYTLTVQDNTVITVEVPGQETSSSSFVGLKLENTRISDSNAICITKTEMRVNLSAGKCENKSMSNFCANGRCVNNKCQPSLGETCTNSGGDCTCGSDSACETGYKAEDYIDASGSGDDEVDTNKKGCVLPKFVGAQDTNGDKCDNNFECSAGKTCNQATPSSGLSGSYCCPTGEKWDGSSCVRANVYDVVFVPIDYSNSEISSFQTTSENSFKYFRDSVSPFKSCSTPSAHTKAYYADNANGVCDISSSCAWSGSGGPSPPHPYLGNEPRSSWKGCWADMRDCANRVYGSEDWDMVVGMNKGDGFSWGGLAKWFDVGAAIVDDIPQSDTEQTTAHEIGHTLNLRHLSPDGGRVCPVPGGACSAPNNEDCNAPPGLSERRDFLMTYCSSLDRYGPEGYEHMKQNSLQPYLWGSC
ncbi:MAG: hypothetical protein ABEJ87_01545 [Candidatus Nanohalobium sp.]